MVPERHRDREEERGREEERERARERLQGFYLEAWLLGDVTAFF